MQKSTRTVLDPVCQIGNLASVAAIDEALLQLPTETLDHVVNEMLFAQDGVDGEELLVRLHIPGVEVVAARAEDVLEPVALGLGVGDFIKVTLRWEKDVTRVSYCVLELHKG